MFYIASPFCCTANVNVIGDFCHPIDILLCITYFARMDLEQSRTQLHQLLYPVNRAAYDPRRWSSARFSKRARRDLDSNKSALAAYSERRGGLFFFKSSMTCSYSANF